MNPEKYNRSISLLCPTCGCSDFSYEDGCDETIQVMTCASCDREFNKDELIQENMNLKVKLAKMEERILLTAKNRVKK